MILEESSLIGAASLPIAITHSEARHGGPEAQLRYQRASVAGGQRAPVGGPGAGEDDGNQTQAARLLHITRDTLRYKMKKYNLR